MLWAPCYQFLIRSFFIVSLFFIQGTCTEDNKYILAFVYGPASVGKTFLSTALHEYAPRTWKVIDEDALYHEYTVQQVQDTLPHEYAIIVQAIDRHNIFAALKFDQISWKEEATKGEREAAYGAIKVVRTYLDDPEHKYLSDELFESLCAYERSLINQYMSEGYHVLVDGWVLKSFNTVPYPDNAVPVSVLLYCSFEELIKRVPARKERAWKSNQMGQVRFFRHSLINFNQKFMLKEQEEGALGTLTREAALATFDFVRHHLVLSDHAQGDVSFFSRGEFTREQLDAYQETFMKSFTSDSMYVFPRSNDDIVITTHDHTPAECAFMLMNIA